MHDRSLSLCDMILNYLICGIKIRCEIPFDVMITDESLPFLCDFDTSDVTFSFVPVPKIKLPCDRGTWMDDQCYINDNGKYSVYHCPVRGQPAYAHVSYSDSDMHSIVCQYVDEYRRYISCSRNILELLGIESILLKFSTFILHASYINWNGKAILFSAPSGTGKSTQADLWNKYRNATVINGDRAGISCRNDEWFAFGLPLAGSSRIYKNEHFPISALVFLRQASYNKMNEISSREAIGLIFPEVTIHRWDTNFIQRILDVLEKMLLQIPIYMLECLPDEGAVCALEAKLSEGRITDGTCPC